MVKLFGDLFLHPFVTISLFSNGHRALVTVTKWEILVFPPFCIKYCIVVKVNVVRVR